MALKSAAYVPRTRRAYLEEEGVTKEERSTTDESRMEVALVLERGDERELVGAIWRMDRSRGSSHPGRVSIVWSCVL